MEDILPEGWELVKLHDIGEIITGNTPKKSERENYGNDYPFYKPADLDQGFFTTTANDNLSEIGISKARLLPEKSILVTSIGATIGKTGFIRRKGASNQQINAIVPYSPIPPELVYYYCISNKFQEELVKNASTTTLPIINKSKFSELSFPFPPLVEQKRIVKKLDAAFEKLRIVEEALEDVPKLIKDLKKSVLYHAVTGALSKDWRKKSQNIKPTEQHIKEIEKTKVGNLKVRSKNSITEKIQLYQLPKNWSWIPNYKLAKDKNNSIGAGPFGTIFKAKDFREEGVPIIFLRHVGVGEYLTHKPKFMDTKVWDKLHKPYSVYGGELLIAKLGDPPGQCTIYPEGIGTAMVTPDVIKMEVDGRTAYKEYLMHFFNSPIFKAFIEKVAFGMTRLRIDLNIFKNMPIPLPPIKEQKYIVEKINEIIGGINDIEKIYASSIAEIEQIRKSLLRKAFRGELVKQSPNDEPASVLLEKIKKEKKKLEAELKAQQKKRRSTPKRKRTMRNLEILEVLKINGKPMRADEVWKESKYYKDDIDGFYEQLRREVEIAKNVDRTIDKDQITYLSLNEKGN